MPFDRAAGNVRSQRGVGLAYYRLTQYGDAAAAYRQAVKLAPNDADLHNDLGNALRRHGEYREAARVLRRAIDLVPTLLSLYGIDGMDVDPKRAAIPGTTPPHGLPTFLEDGSILPPGRRD